MRQLTTIINLLCFLVPIVGYYILHWDISPIYFVFVIIPIIYYHMYEGMRFTFKFFAFLLTVIFISIGLGLFHIIDMKFALEIVIEAISLGVATMLIVFMINNLIKDNEYLMHIIMEDPLTGLYNRRYFMLKINKEFNKHKKSVEPFTLLMLDLDYFKRCNDNCGHSTGDIILKEFSKNLLNAIRKSDIAARFGGEEFAVILPNTSLEQAMHIAERIRKTTEDYIFSVRLKTMPCEQCKKTVSIGVAILDSNCHNPLQLIDRADEALYRAKVNRNAVCK